MPQPVVHWQAMNGDREWYYDGQSETAKIQYMGILIASPTKIANLEANWLVTWLANSEHGAAAQSSKGTERIAKAVVDTFQVLYS